MPRKLLSIVSPVYNESEGISWFHNELRKELGKLKKYDYEIVYVNDGSADSSLTELKKLKSQPSVKVSVIDLSRNFGKEAALSAGIHHATGHAVLTLDSDGQHPITSIPEFIQRWEAGNEVVVGIRTANKNEGVIKRYGSKIFYTLFNKITGELLIPGSTDFRLVDRKVVDEFKRLEERSRITRGLIDWLGFKRDFVHFAANERKFGTAGYSFKKLVVLAINTFVSMSAVPLFIAGYTGVLFVLLSVFSGLFIFVEQIILDDPLKLSVTGTAMLGIVTTFLVGIVLIAQGLIGVYLSKLLLESQRRPLFIVREKTTRS